MSVDYQQPIGPEGAAILAQEIAWSIKYLNLSMYALGDDGMQAIIAKGSQWP